MKTNLAARSFPFLFFHRAQSKHASQERDFFTAKTTCDKERSSVCEKITSVEFGKWSQGSDSSTGTAPGEH